MRLFGLADPFIQNLQLDSFIDNFEPEPPATKRGQKGNPGLGSPHNISLLVIADFQFTPFL